jgi:hypothetical protein
MVEEPFLGQGRTVSECEKFEHLVLLAREVQCLAVKLNISGLNALVRRSQGHADSVITIGVRALLIEDDAGVAKSIELMLKAESIYTLVSCNALIRKFSVK